MYHQPSMPLKVFFDLMLETSFLDSSLALMYPSLFSNPNTLEAAIVVSCNKVHHESLKRCIITTNLHCPFTALCVAVYVKLGVGLLHVLVQLVSWNTAGQHRLHQIHISSPINEIVKRISFKIQLWYMKSSNSRISKFLFSSELLDFVNGMGELACRHHQLR